MKAQKVYILFMILMTAGFSQACKETPKKKTGSQNITDPNYDPYASNSTANGVPYISVTGAIGSSVSVALNTPANVSFSITNAQNVQSILTSSPVGSQLSGNTTLNPTFYWATPIQGIHSVTIFARNMTLCETTSPGNCQLSTAPILNPSYDAQTTVSINVGSTGGTGIDPNTGLPYPNTGIDPNTGLPYPNTGIDPNTGLPYPNTSGGNINLSLIQQIAQMLGIDVSFLNMFNGTNN